MNQLVTLASFRIGMTGTRKGMTHAQAERFMDGLDIFKAVEPNLVLIHGDCVGADCHAWMIATAKHIHTVAYPSTSDPKWHANTPSTVRTERCGSLTRNRLIVEHCDVLYAFPPTMEEEPRGGTWYTIRHARTFGRKLNIIWPDGSASHENDEHQS